VFVEQKLGSTVGHKPRMLLLFLSCLPFTSGYC